MADLTVRVNARTRDAEAGLGRVTRQLAGMRAMAAGAGLGGAKALGIANLGSIALVTASQLSALIAALAAVALAAIPLPGLLAGLAVAGIGLGLALKDAGKYLGDLGPQFAAVQRAASGEFWAQAAAPIRNLATSVLPTLTAGMASVAGAWGGYVSAMAGSLQRLTSGPGFAALFTQTAAAIRIAQGAIGPFLGALGAIGSVGVSYIVPLTQYLTDLSNRFSSFIQQAAASGQLQQWAQTGITALSQLGQVVGLVGGILGTLIRSMAQFGGASSLNPLIAGLTSLNAALAGPVGQGLLAQVFGAAQQAIVALQPAFAALGTALAALVPVLAAALPAAAQITSALFAALAPVVVQLAAAVTPLAQQLGPVLASALQSVAPLLQMLASAVFPVLSATISALLPVAGQLISALAAGLQPVIAALVPILLQMIPIIQQQAGSYLQIVQAVAPLLVQLGQLLASLAPLVGAILQVSAAITAMQWQAMAQGVQVVMPLLSGLVSILRTLLGPTITWISGLVTAAGQAMSGDWRGAMSTITNAATQAGSQLRSTWTSAMSAVGQAVQSGLTRVGQWFMELPGKITSSLSGLPGQLRSIGVNMIQGMIGGISAMAGQVASKAREVVAGAVSAAKSALQIASPSRVFAQIGRYSGQGLVRGLEDMRSRVASAGADLAGSAIPDAPTFSMRGAGQVTGGAGGGAGSVQIIIQGALDPGAVARQVREILNNDAILRGVTPTGGMVLR
ncbi:hypothetical protein CGZ94_04945 [Enemella evansiae]|uniref:Phage tail protein n=1 Tax=Enemella evansiae TaxID=2016499 RepID=A0A255GKD9_9ACTN|nr:hypothetical protein [Enemella evansiae]OYO16290.1 hypothetical protein CGZ94_04945 [Enemella evansiae]